MTTLLHDPPRPLRAPEDAPHPSGVVLRPYQVDCLTAIANARTRGRKRGLVVLPTGCGKTVIFTTYIAQHPEARAVILVHRDELVQQSLQKLHEAAPDLVPGVIKAERNDVGARVIVASVNTLQNPRRLAQLGPVDLIVVDEAHHATAPSYLRILTACGAFHVSGPLVLGWTATADRSDGKGLGEVFEAIIYDQPMLPMVNAGYLKDLHGVQVKLAAEFNKLHVQAGDYKAKELGAMLADADAPVHAAQAYVEHAKDRTGIVFTATVPGAYAMADAFCAQGIRAEALDGETPLDDRRAILARLASGATQVVANCMVLTEGFDCPRVNCIVVARPTRSRLLYTQMIGRGTRTYLGQDDCLVIDLVGATERLDLQTLPTLFGFASGTNLAAESVSEVAERQERERVEREAAIADAASQQAQRGRLVAEAVDLFHRRRFTWLAGERGQYLLPIPGGRLVLQPDADVQRWRVVEVHGSDRPVLHAEGLSLAYAQGRAEDIARERGGEVLRLRDAPWRIAPATDAQRRRFYVLRIPWQPGLTRGEASDLISTAEARRSTWRTTHDAGDGAAAVQALPPPPVAKSPHQCDATGCDLGLDEPRAPETGGWCLRHRDRLQLLNAAWCADWPRVALGFAGPDAWRTFVMDADDAGIAAARAALEGAER